MQIDLKTKKLFLRRSKCEGVEAKDFYVGAVVTIYSRSMKITNFADQSTKEKLSAKISKYYFCTKMLIRNIKNYTDSSILLGLS